jgi:predicted nucleotidyltransferase
VSTFEKPPRPPIEPRVERVVDRVAAALMEEGARAVILVGSHATGDATADSDIDLAAVGDGPHYRLEIQDALLVSVGWATAEEQIRRLSDPAWLGSHVPGWRHCVVLQDPDAVAAEIKQQALDWEWERATKECNEWVAANVAGLAEEVLKVVASLRTGDDLNAAAQRSVIAQRLAIALAIHRRILYGSENRLWSLVADELGARWSAAQASALGLTGDDLQASCRSALELFELAVHEVREVFNERQLAVVEHACRLAREL